MLSIDVGSHKVCIVEGTCKKGQVTITACGEIAYKSEVVVNGEIRDRATLIFMINEIIKTNKMKSRSAIITINNPDIISRDLKLPDVAIPQLHQLVKNEISKITEAGTDFVTDFAIWEKTDDKMLRVMAYAMTEEQVADYYELLRKCKLKPFALDIHANAIKKLFTNKKRTQEPEETRNIMVVDVGFGKINFHGYLGNKCIFNRSELSPVQGFARDLSALQHVEEGFDAFKDIDFSPNYVYEDPTMGETCRYMLSRLADEIQKYNQYIMMHSSDKYLPKIYLCGGIAYLKNMDIALAERLNQPVELLTAISNVTLPKNCMLSKVCNAVGALIRHS